MRFQLLAVVLLFGFRIISAQEVILSPENTAINFEINHLSVLSVEGTFEEYSGTLFMKDSIWTISGVIDVSSINTNNSTRDETLRTDAYFDIENYPQIQFEGNGFPKKDSLFISGALTLKGITSELEFNFLMDETTLISETIRISREEIGFSFDSMDMLIGDEVRIWIEIDMK